jgi:hypothetical protein
MPKTAPLRLALVAGLMLGLGACGKLGPLEQPPPLIGQKAKADYAAKKAAEAEAKAAKKAAENQSTTVPNAAADQPDPKADKPIDNAPKTTRDIQDPNQKLTRLRDAPVDGSPNPFGGSVNLTPPN